MQNRTKKQTLSILYRKTKRNSRPSIYSLNQVKITKLGKTAPYRVFRRKFLSKHSDHRSHPRRPYYPKGTLAPTKLLYIMKASSPFLCNNPLKDPSSHHGPNIPLNGCCVEGISILVSENTKYEMKVLQNKIPKIMRVATTRDPIPYIYKMTVTLKPGLNHIAWCTESTAISVYPKKHPSNDLLLLPKFGFGTMTTYELEETNTPYYTDEEGPLSTYKKIDPPLLDPVRPKVYAFQHNAPPKFLTVISPEGKIPALWVWAKVYAGGHGFQAVKRAAAQIDLPDRFHSEHTWLIKHRKTSCDRSRLATYEGELDNFEHRLRRDTHTTPRSYIHRPSAPPPCCGPVPEPATDESEPEDGRVHPPLDPDRVTFRDHPGNAFFLDGDYSRLLRRMSTSPYSTEDESPPPTP
jgi:hypothetical protein